MVNPLLHMISNHTKQNFAEFQCYVKLANLAKTLVWEPEGAQILQIELFGSLEAPKSYK